MVPAKPRLFISHSSKDNAVAAQLRLGLLPQFDVFLDQCDLRIGDKWQDAIEAQIAASHCAVVVLSPHVLAKPDWVNAEAFAFSLRQRVFDPSFRMVPVLLDGVTEKDLNDGPLAKSKLAEIQAPSMTSAAIDLPAILAGLAPVLTQFQALLPFQEVARSLAALIGPLDPNAQEMLADAIGLAPLELQGAVNKGRWIAAGLLRAERADLEIACRELEKVAERAAREIFKVAAPYTWVDARAAETITAAALAPPPRVSLAMKAGRRETPRLYVRRASLRLPEWPTFDADDFAASVTPGNPAPSHAAVSVPTGPTPIEAAILLSIRTELARFLGFSTKKLPEIAVLERELDAAYPGEPVFIVLPHWFAELGPSLLESLRTALPRIVFLLWSQTPPAALEQQFPDVLKRLPDVDETDEDAVYRMYKRRIPDGEAWW